MVRKGKQATIKKHSRVRAPLQPDVAGRREGGERKEEKETEREKK